MGLASITFKIKDMDCLSCEARLQGEIGKLAGVVGVRANYLQRSLWTKFDPTISTRADVEAAIRQAGYTVGEAGKSKVIGLTLIFAVIMVFSVYSGGIHLDSMLGSQASYFMLFVVGVLTSLHCVGMCGGIQLSQTIVKEENGGHAWKPAVLYNLGRLAAYTSVGGVVGALGAAIAFSLSIKAGVMSFAGIFMVLLGVNLVGFRLPLPIPAKLQALCSEKLKTQGPFAVGLLNGLLPCGPLQAVQLYALGAGSAMAGAAVMFLFGLGTIPLMLPLGLATGWVSRNYGGKVLRFSGVLVIVLGLIMAGRGLAIAGVTVPGGMNLHQAKVEGAAVKAEIENGVQVIRMAATDKGYVPDVLFVQKGIPVKWVVDGQQLNSCNNEIIVPSLNIQKKLQPNENIIEFTPGSADIPFSCWMGMIKGTIRVVDDLSATDVSMANTSQSGCACATTDGHHMHEK